MQPSHGNRGSACNRWFIVALATGLSGCLPHEAEIQALRDSVTLMETQLAALPEPQIAAQSHQRLGFFGRTAEPAWIEIDLGNDTAFEEVVLFPARAPGAAGENAAIDLPSHLTLLAAADSGPLQVLGAWPSVEPPPPSPTCVRMPTPGARARRLRLEFRSDSSPSRQRFFSLGEVVVLAHDQNLALGKPVRTSPGILNPPRWAPDNLTDGFLWCGTLLGALRSPSNGFHSRIESSASAVPKWIEIDLEDEIQVQEIRLVPARPRDFADVAGFGFPPRARLTCFSSDDGVVTETPLGLTDGAPFPNPGDAAVCVPLPNLSVRRVRLTAEALWQRSGDFIFALAELQVFSDGQNRALGRQVRYSDHVAAAASWQPQALVDGFDSQRDLLSWQQWLDSTSLRASLAHAQHLARQRLATLERTQQRNLARSVAWLVGLMLVAGGGLVAWLHHRQTAARQRLREDIARDLHDEVGSALCHLSLLAHSGHPEALPRIAAGAQDLQHVMRDLVWLLKPGGGKGHGRDLTDRLRTCARALLDPAVPEVTVHCQGEPPDKPLPLDWMREVLLFTREALSNAARHSSARSAVVRIEWRPHTFAWSLEEDGVGFDETAAEFTAGAGLHNLRHRATVLKGAATLTSRPGGGTRVELLCPLPHGTLVD